MNVIFTNCKDCGHTEVCSLKDQFKVVTDKLNLDVQRKEPNSELSGLSYIKIYITCSYFHKNGPTFRPLDNVDQLRWTLDAIKNENLQKEIFDKQMKAARNREVD